MLPLLAAGALAGASYFGSKSKNKKAPKAPAFKPYEGYKPPAVEYLRPVEKQITDILMRRSQGQDVGYDPQRREELLNEYDIVNKRAGADEESDILNALSGTGLSRNIAARDELLGRAKRRRSDDAELYRTRVDVEDLARRNEERDVNTGRLQQQNSFNFGQENARAAFDLDVYNAERGAELGAFGAQNQAFQNYEDPIGNAIESGIGAFALSQGVPSTGGGLPSAARPSDAFSSYYNPRGTNDSLSYYLKRKNLGGR